MNWIKKGLIYNVAHYSDWAYSHAHKPSVLLLNQNILRIYFGVRDRQNRTRTTFIDVNPDNPKEIIYEHDRPVLDLGKLGAFDDAGANVSCLVKHNDLIYMYFIGWNPGTTVSTRNAIGVAVSKDNGVTFERLFDGPIFGRTPEEPYYTGAICVMIQDDLWKAWYTSGTHFEIVNGNPEICYHIKYCESEDGIHWKRPGISCIPPQHSLEVTARPSVLYENEKYRMWYSYRSMRGFREKSEAGYRIGYAESTDGKQWVRMDEQAGIGLSKYGWDSRTIAYPAVYRYKEKLYMIYNGNDFGASGFGYAVLEE